MPDKWKKDHSPQKFSSMRTTRYIGRFLWIFFGLTLVVTGVIAYQALVRTTISFARSPYPVTTTFSTTISESPDNDELHGSFTVETITHTYSTDELGETRSIPDKATGTIRVINNWSQAQPLQATTRFVTSEGVLFRTTERVDVPAGGETTVSVVADEAGNAGNVPSGTRFTIPGLWEGLRDDIYGINDSAFTGGTKDISAVSQNDIDEAIQTALTELEEKAHMAFQSETNDTTTYAIQTEIISQQASAQAGDEASSLTVTVQARYVVLTLSSSVVAERVLEKVNVTLTDDEEVDRATLRVGRIEIDRINTEDRVLIMRITANADVWLLPTASIFQPVSLQNKSLDDLEAIAENEQGILSVGAIFSPFWISRTPSDPSRITVQVQ